MIKIFLKHFIYDKCLQLLFDSVILNFSKAPDSDKEIYARALKTWHESVINGYQNSPSLVRPRNQLGVVLTAYHDYGKSDLWQFEDIEFFTKNLQNAMDRIK